MYMDALMDFPVGLICLEVGSTNKNPAVVARYYLEAVKQVGGVPRKIRSDDGTENRHI